MEKVGRDFQSFFLILILSSIILVGNSFLFEIEGKEKGILEKKEVVSCFPKTLKEMYANLYLDPSFYENRQDMIEEELKEMGIGESIDIIEDEVPQGRAIFKGEGTWPVVVDLDSEELPRRSFKAKRKSIIASASGVELFLKPLLIVLGALLFFLTTVETLLKRDIRKAS